MEKKQIIQALQTVRKEAKKRKFTQSFDLILNLTEIDIKRDAEKVNTFITLPHTLGKTLRVTALIGPALSTKAKKNCQHTILAEEFSKLDKKKIKAIAKQTDFFIAQADIMPKVAGTFGKILGPRGLMPSPKAGCVIPPTAELEPVIERLKKTIQIALKNEPTIKVTIGTESMKDEELADNALAVYNAVILSLPQEKNNIKNIILKLTMSTPIVVGETQEKKEQQPKK